MLVLHEKALDDEGMPRSPLSRPPSVPIAGRVTSRDWLLLVLVAVMWGSSFLLIKIGLVDLEPTAVAWLRLAFGAAALALIPAARKPLRHRKDWGLVAVLGVVWMAVPFTLFPIAEQTIPSALAGMINGATPLFTAALAMAWYRRSPGSRLLVGLGVGFVGVIVLNIPAADGVASLGGIGMILLATVFYGVAFNLAGPLENRNGSLPVIWRAQLVGLVVSTPTGLVGLAGSTPTVGSMTAMAALGILSTGVGFVLFTYVLGRVGAAKASVTSYLMPIVSIVLGAGLAAEPIAALSLVGIALVLVGAYLVAGSKRSNDPPAQKPSELSYAETSSETR